MHAEAYEGKKEAPIRVHMEGDNGRSIHIHINLTFDQPGQWKCIPQ